MGARITGISSMATRRILADLSERYQRETGCEVAIKPMGGVDAAKLVRAGDATDVVLLASNVMKRLEDEGHVVAGSIVGFARSGIAFAVRSGTPHPNLATEEAVKQAILAARKVCYSTGPSGDHLLGLCERWQISDVVSERLMQAPPGVPVGTLVAQGDADLGFQQLSELMNVPGIDIAGSLPAEIQAITVFAAGISSASSQIEATRALIDFFIAADTAATKREHGMEPA